MIVSLRISTPEPPQRPHAVCCSRPDPPHASQLFENTMLPRRDRMRPAALAALTARFGDLQSARPAARLAGIPARQRHLPLRAAHRLVEGQRDRCMQIGAAHRLGRLPLLPLREDLGEQIAECRRVRVAPRRWKNRTPRTRTTPMSIPQDSAPASYRSTPIRIAQRLVRARDLLEAGFRRVVARVDVRVILPRQAACRSA